MENILDSSNNETVDENYIGNIPSKSLKFISYILIVFVLLIIILSAVIKYPDTERVNVILTTDEQRTHLIAKTSGSVEFLVEDGEYVNDNTIIALIKNSANYEDIKGVEKVVKDLLSEIHSNKPFRQLKIDYKLGDLGEDYYDFFAAYEKFKLAKSDKVLKKNLLDLNEKLNIKGSHSEILKKQIRIENEGVKLRTELYDSTLKSFEANATTRDDLLLEKSRMLEQVKKEQSATASLKQSAEQIQETKIAINTKLNNYQEVLSQSQIDFFSVASVLISKIEDWKDKFLLRSNIKGNVVFLKEWRNNQFVMIGDEVATIVPVNEKHLCIGYVNPSSLPKLSLGQKIVINFDGYNSYDFGNIEGKLERISTVSHDSISRVLISLPNNLTTTQNKKIQFIHEQKGVGNIIIENKSILVRIFERVYNLFYEQ